jgi:glycosyltransferase involved in cell wall biosynthesis
MLYVKAPWIAATSEEVIADLLDHVDGRIEPGRMVILPNPLDASDIRRLAAIASVESSRVFRFCAIGRLMRQKGYDILLSALAIAAPQMRYRWELVICGNGPLRDELEDQAYKLGLAERVRFVGYVDNPYPILQSSDVFVHPARWEGFGLVIGEALALGVPVVAAACPGGPREILGGGDFGILVPPEDSRALAAALLRVSEDEELRRDLSERGEERVLEYTPERIAEQALELTYRLR